MPEDRSRYGWEKLDPFERHLAENADKGEFSYRPWTEQGMSAVELLAYVRSELDVHGFGAATGSWPRVAG